VHAHFVSDSALIVNVFKIRHVSNLKHFFLLLNVYRNPNLASAFYGYNFITKKQGISFFSKIILWFEHFLAPSTVEDTWRMLEGQTKFQWLCNRPSACDKQAAEAIISTTGSKNYKPLFCFKF